jgi:predicted nucleotidyltransferase
MKEMTMLDLSQVALSSLAEALEDHSGMTRWFLDRATGQVEPWPIDLEVGEAEEIDDRDLVEMEPAPSSEGYRDMEDFIGRVSDPRARDLLERAIAGRGAFRRFKDTLFEFPDLRQAWLRFHDVRVERRAIEWLRGEGLVHEAAAEQAIRERPDPEPPTAASAERPLQQADVLRIAGEVARDLRKLYGDRLVDVILFGSWARGDAHPESDIDLMVVLADMESPWDELRRMEGILWRHSFDNDTVLSALLVTVEDYRSRRTPTLMRVRAEGRRVA